MSADRLLDAGELAEVLHVPKSWVLRQARDDAIPHLRLGRYVRFDRAAVLEWLGEQQSGGGPAWRKHRPQVNR